MTFNAKSQRKAALTFSAGIITMEPTKSLSLKKSTLVHEEREMQFRHQLLQPPALSVSAAIQLQLYKRP